jgi:quinol-cytochrome oxidoreductase complex cytochrome b subunit
MPGAIPVVGQTILEFLRGGQAVGEHTLNRFFALHVAVLPLALMGVLALHILLVQLHGMSVPRSVEEKYPGGREGLPSKPMFPHLLWHDLVNCLVLFGVLVTLAVLMPSDLTPPIDYLKPAPEGVKPDWFFLWVYQILKWMPTFVAGIEGEVVGIVGLAVAAAFIALAPFVDWKSQRNRKSPVFTVIGIIAMLVFLVCTAIGFLG